MRVVPILVVFACACGTKHEPAANGSATPVATGASERWAATLVIGANFRDFVVTFTPAGSAATATMTLPERKQPLPLAQVTFTPQQLAFTLEKPSGGKESYTLARTGSTAKGTATIGGHQLLIRMVALGPDEPAHSAFPRPQTPQPPWKYEVQELEVTAPDGGKLAGTLTTPAGSGPFPAILLLSGSGAQDRDETVFGHKPYLIIADRLTRAGFVTFRFDDRGTGKTTGAPGTLDTEIADAAAVLDVLATQKQVDPKRLGIIGHSTGGMVAPNAALKHPVAFIVSLAGVAVSGRELVPLQQQLALAHAGVPADVAKQQLDAQRAIGDAAAKDPALVKPALVAVAAPQLEKTLGRKPTQAEIDQAIAKPLAEATAPWTISFFRLDPRVAWKQLKLPVLLLVGDKDTQVPADVTIDALQKSVGDPKQLTAKKLPGLDHLFQHATTGFVDEYVEIDESFAPEALDALTAWLVATAHVK
jgi:pimeloyl-ACP methyl ester carboxylesterase